MTDPFAFTPWHWDAVRGIPFAKVEDLNVLWARGCHGRMSFPTARHRRLCARTGHLWTMLGNWCGRCGVSKREVLASETGYA